MIEAIIFDWFGVCSRRLIPLWQREINPKVDENQLEKYFLQYLDDYAINNLSGHEFLNAVFQKIHVDPESYYYLLRTLPDLNHELLDMILKLRKNGYKTAILSDNFNDIVPVIEKKLGGFDIYFDVICLSNRLNMGKSHKQIYVKTCDLLSGFGVHNKNCIFVDDREKYLNVAKLMGWKTVLYENNLQLRNVFYEHSVIVD